MSNYASNEYSACRQWIAEKLNNGYSWDDVRHLCAAPGNEEEEFNSDEYISSTMLDVETNTYIEPTGTLKITEKNNAINVNNYKYVDTTKTGTNIQKIPMFLSIYFCSGSPIPVDRTINKWLNIHDNGSL